MNQLDQPVIANAIKPHVWGPGCWTLLHSVTLAYPLQPSSSDQIEMRDFIRSLSKVLPCYSCKQDFSAMLESDPVEPHLHSRRAFFQWLVKQHNTVNAKLGKPVLTPEAAIQQWVQPEREPATTTALKGGQVSPARSLHGLGIVVLVIIAVASLFLVLRP